MSHANKTKFHYNTLYKLLAACLKIHEIKTDYVPLHLSTLQFKMVKIQNVKISTCFRLLYIKSSLTKTLQVVTPIEYSSLQFVRKTTWFLQRKMHDHFPNIVILKGRLHSDSFLYVLYRSIKFKKGIFLHDMCIILQCTQPFYPSNAQKHFIVKRKLAYHVHLLFLRSSNKDLWEFNENFNRKKQQWFVWVLIRVFGDIHYVADRKKVNRLWLPLE